MDEKQFYYRFPSLKGKSCEPLRFRKIKYAEDDDLCEACIMDYKKDASLHTRETEEFRVFSMDDIQENCVDRTETTICKEAILSAINHVRNHKRLSNSYKEDVIAVLNFVITGEPFDGCGED